MNTNEVANLIEILRGVGWTDTQITELQLGIEGRTSIADAVEKVKAAEKTE